MLQNAYFVAKIGADTVENERNFAENLPKIGNYSTGPAVVSLLTRTAPEAASCKATTKVQCYTYELFKNQHLSDTSC